MTERSGTLLAAVLDTRGYIVGDANAPSGLHVLHPNGSWLHKGWTNVRAFGVALGDMGVNEILLAGGNGLLRSTDGGETWRVETDWKVTEVLDVAIDRHRNRTWLATAHGVFCSSDYHRWRAVNRGLRSTFCQRIVVDPFQPRVLVGTEEGLAIWDEDSADWTPIGPPTPIRDLVQSSAEPHRWVAGTEDHGVLVSADGARTWMSAEGPVSRCTIYAVAINPQEPNTMAAAGFDRKLFLSRDGGKTWRATNPKFDDTVHALAFEPDSNSLWMGTGRSGVYRYESRTGELFHAGLRESRVRRLVFQE